MSRRKTGSPSRRRRGARREVDVHGPGDRVRDDQRRGGEVVHPHVGVDAALEVAVAREHRGDREAALREASRSPLGAGRSCRCRSCSRNRRGRSRACRDTGERRRGRSIHDPRARSQRGLHPRLGARPALDGLFREQAGADHHRRVGGVRAAGDRSNTGFDCWPLSEMLLRTPQLILGTYFQVETAGRVSQAAGSGGRPAFRFARAMLFAHRRGMPARWGELPRVTTPRENCSADELAWTPMRGRGNR